MLRLQIRKLQGNFREGSGFWRRGEDVCQPLRWREHDVAACRLLRVVGGGVAADHVWGGVTEQVLNVQLARILLDGPGGEGMAEAVGMDLGEAGLASQAPEELLEAVGPQGDAGTQGAMPACSDEEGAGLSATKPQIELQRLPAAQRVPLVLYHLEGLKYEEIAAKLHVSLGKVKTDIFRGREALRKRLSPVLAQELN